MKPKARHHFLELDVYSETHFCKMRWALLYSDSARIPRRPFVKNSATVIQGGAFLGPHDGQDSILNKDALLPLNALASVAAVVDTSAILFPLIFSAGSRERTAT